eukprot:gnl/MRDRNA2_/MRDRNA2_91577_c0_seq1.p1 gnl/MRDRNA2_/MRDRNA2_91577_c0~~gnl/MRDRNA2_/MRDRNA2_91577_c0_seq1.p1  ORF type:complete len:235 (+),score=22.98 gnl/MRDRNA2_/MRDRNA2_91577_c0_seq1:91-795(+)
MAFVRNHWQHAVVVACVALALGHFMPPLPAGASQKFLDIIQRDGWKSLASELVYAVNEKRKTLSHDDVMEFITAFMVMVLCYLMSFVLVMLTLGQLALVPFYELLGVEPYQLSPMFASIWTALMRLTGERSLVVPLSYSEDPDAQCSICFEKIGKVARVCNCSFTVHLACLEEWRLVGKSRQCTLCKDDYILTRPPAANCFVAITRILGVMLGVFSLQAFVAFANWLTPGHMLV